MTYLSVLSFTGPKFISFVQTGWNPNDNLRDDGGTRIPFQMFAEAVAIIMSDTLQRECHGTADFPDDDDDGGEIPPSYGYNFSNN